MLELEVVFDLGREPELQLAHRALQDLHETSLARRNRLAPDAIDERLQLQAVSDRGSQDGLRDARPQQVLVILDRLERAEEDREPGGRVIDQLAYVVVAGKR